MSPNPVYPTVAAAYAAAAQRGWTDDRPADAYLYPWRVTYPDGDVCELAAVGNQTGWQWRQVPA